MPELPEVETVRRQLAKVWTGRTIHRVRTSQKSYFFVTNPASLRKKLVGQTLVALERHGKYLLAHFHDGGTLLLHLGMTGQLVARELPSDPHVHLVLELGEKRVITFRDVRKFGKVQWLSANQSCERLDKLGCDALSADPKAIARLLRKRSICIKTALLDQKIWAGVGNIYADEALFRASVRPTRSARRLSQKTAERVVLQTQAILADAVEHGGSTINDYIQPEGELGGFQNWHQVYGKAGRPCLRCGAIILRTVLAARSTHFCPKCQK